jgi:hypothetical protein
VCTIPQCRASPLTSAHCRQAETICIKEPSIKTPLTQNSDWYEQEVTLADPSGFQIGDGIVLRTRNPHNGSFDTYKRTIVAQRQAVQAE